MSTVIHTNGLTKYDGVDPQRLWWLLPAISEIAAATGALVRPRERAPAG